MRIVHEESEPAGDSWIRQPLLLSDRAVSALLKLRLIDLIEEALEQARVEEPAEPNELALFELVTQPPDLLLRCCELAPDLVS